jgi:mandelate racemase
LIDLETEEGVTGRSYLFCYVGMAAAAIARVLDAAVAAVACDRLAPLDVAAKLARRYRLIGVQGIVRMALAGLDVACWDALSVAAGLPLVSFLGSPRTIIEGEVEVDASDELQFRGPDADDFSCSGDVR